MIPNISLNKMVSSVLDLLDTYLFSCYPCINVYWCLQILIAPVCSAGTTCLEVMYFISLHFRNLIMFMSLLYEKVMASINIPVAAQCTNLLGP